MTNASRLILLGIAILFLSSGISSAKERDGIKGFTDIDPGYTPITSCIEIRNPGTYVLMNDVVKPIDNTSACIIINATQVRFYGNGKTITAIDSLRSSGNGISIMGKDIAIYGGSISDQSMKLRLNASNMGVIVNATPSTMTKNIMISGVDITLSANPGTRGITIGGEGQYAFYPIAKNITIQNSAIQALVTGNAIGIHLVRTSQGNIVNNSLTGLYFGVSFSMQSTNGTCNDQILIDRNRFHRVSYAMSLQFCQTNFTITNNIGTMMIPGVYGYAGHILSLYGTKAGIVSNNTFSVDPSSNRSSSVYIINRTEHLVFTNNSAHGYTNRGMIFDKPIASSTTNNVFEGVTACSSRNNTRDILYMTNETGLYWYNVRSTTCSLIEVLFPNNSSLNIACDHPCPAVNASSISEHID